MRRYIETLWDAFFPQPLKFPLQLVGKADKLITTPEMLEKELQQHYSIFSYRSNFEGITTSSGYVVRTDQGWGCLLRTSQMIVAHFLRRFGYWDDLSLTLFADDSSAAAPFSIHNMINNVWNGKAFRAEYWSPSQGCEAVRKAIQNAVKSGVLSRRIEVVCSSNGCLFSEDVTQAFKKNAQVVLLLISVRASAAAQLTQENYLQLEGLMVQPECVGVVGGVPGRSYFFFGHNQTQLLYLDPHRRVQPALSRLACANTAANIVVPGLEDVRSVHWSRVDTSLFVAFAVQRVDEWNHLKEKLSTKFLRVENSRHLADYQIQSHSGCPARICLSPLYTWAAISNAEAPTSDPRICCYINHACRNEPRGTTHEEEGDGDEMWGKMSELEEMELR